MRYFVSLSDKRNSLDTQLYAVVLQKGAYLKTRKVASQITAMAKDHFHIPGNIKKVHLKYFLTEASTLSYCIVYVHYR